MSRGNSHRWLAAGGIGYECGQIHSMGLRSFGSQTKRLILKRQAKISSRFPHARFWEVTFLEHRVLPYFLTLRREEISLEKSSLNSKHFKPRKIPLVHTKFLFLLRPFNPSKQIQQHHKSFGLKTERSKRKRKLTQFNISLLYNWKYIKSTII